MPLARRHARRPVPGASDSEDGFDDDRRATLARRTRGRAGRAPGGDAKLIVQVHEGRRLRRIVDEDLELFPFVKAYVDSVDQRRPTEAQTAAQEGDQVTWEETLELSPSSAALRDPESALVVELWSDDPGGPELLGQRQYKLQRFAGPDGAIEAQNCVFSNATGLARVSIRLLGGDVDDGSPPRARRASATRGPALLSEEDEGGADVLREAFENSRSVTASSVPTVVRVATGKPLLSSQRHGVTKFCNKNGLGLRDRLSLAQFEALCDEIGVRVGPSRSAGLRGTAAAPASPASPASYKRGDRVEARFRGGAKYYEGEIVRVNADGTYAINYVDGDKERAVDPSVIRPLGGSGARSPGRSPARGRLDSFDDSAPEEVVYRRGQRVEARFRGKHKWFKGKITRVHVDGTYDIDYDDGDAERRVRSALIRDPRGARSGSPGALSLGSDQGGGDAVTEAFEAEARVTVSTVSNVIRKITGKPVLSAQRRQIMDFARQNGIGTRDTFELDQFQDLCSALGVSGGADKSGGGPRRRSRSPRDRGLDDEPAVASYKRGDRVEARFRGGAKYYEGEIVRVNADGTYAINYVDGDKERAVDPSVIRPLGGSGARSSGRSPARGRLDSFDDSAPEEVVYRRGQRVEARFRGKHKWFKGKITRVHVDGTYDIDYDDGDAERRVRSALIRDPRGARSGSPGTLSLGSDRGGGDAVTEAFEAEARVTVSTVSNVIRKITGKPVLSAQRRQIMDFARQNGIGTRDTFELDQFQDLCAALGVSGGADKSGGGPRRRSRSPRDRGLDDEPAVASYNRGDRVEARFRGGAKYYEGEIVRVNADGTYAINYVDGDKERAVDPSVIRPLGGSGARSSGRSPARGRLDSFDDSAPEEVVYRRGQRVEARFRGKHKWFKGKITRVHVDGTYDIDYDDGDAERRVRSALIRDPRGARSGSPGALSLGSDQGGGDAVTEAFEAEARVTVSTVSNVIRKITGKPVLSAQRRQIMDFARQNGIGTRDTFELDQFQDLCAALGVSGGVDKSGGGPRRRSRSPRDRGLDDEPAVASYKRGDRVEARFRGGAKYYEGEIVRVNADGTYAINYVDGDKERAVDPSVIRPLGGSGARSSGRSPARGRLDSFDDSAPEEVVYRRGQRVEARFRGKHKWFKGKITRVHVDGTYDIDYDDGDAERRVRSALIRDPRGARSGSPGTLSLGSDRGGGDAVTEAFEAEARVTVSTVSNVIRKITGKPVLSAQRRQIMDFARQNGIGTRDTFELDQFQDLCAALGVSGAPAGGLRGRSRSPRDDDRIAAVGESYKRGDRVEARFRGGPKYYKGEITRVNMDGTYAISYADGDKEREVDASLIRRPGGGGRGGTTGEMRRGSRVEAQYKGGRKYYAGEVTRVHSDGSCDIAYDDGDSERRVPPRKIREIEDPGPAILDGGDDDDDDAVLNFRRGQRVQARFKGGRKYYGGEIVRVNRDGTCAINYDDGDRETSVPVELIKPEARSPSRGDSRRRTSGGSGRDPLVERATYLFEREGRVTPSRAPMILRKLTGEPISSEQRRLLSSFMRKEGLRSTDELSLGQFLDLCAQLGITGGDDAAALSASDREETGLAVGDKVKARFKGSNSWYSGSIVAKHRDGTFDIDYDDGDFETRVAEDLIRPAAASSPGRRRASPPHRRTSRTSRDEPDPGVFEEGQAVEAKFKGTGAWYKGRISRAHSDGTFDIAYDDGDFESRVAPRLMRAVGGGAARPRARGTKLRAGTKVQAPFKGSAALYTGKISRDNGDGTFNIAFDDGDRDPRVPEADIKVEGTGSPSGAGAGGRRERGRGRSDLRARFDELDEPVLVRNAANVIGTLLGKALDSSQRRDVYMFCKRKRLGASDEVPFDIFAAMCAELGLIDNDGGGSGNETSSADSLEGRGRRRSASPSRRERSRRGRASRSSSPRERPSRHGRSREGSDSEPEYEVGDRVEGLFGNGTVWYTGAVVKVHRDGTCDVDYDDGDKEQRKPKDKLRPLGGQPRRASRRRDGRARAAGGGDDGRIWRKMRRLALQESEGGGGHRPPSMRDIDSIGSPRGKIKRLLGARRYKELRKAFDKYDRNGDGVLTEEDVRKTFRDMGKRASQREVRKWLRELDTDQDGAVDFVEFVKAYAGVSVGSEDSSGSSEGSASPRGRRRSRSRTKRRSSRRGRGRRRRSRHVDASDSSSSSTRSSSSSSSSRSSTASSSRMNLWRKEAWAVALGEDVRQDLEDAFADHCIKTRRGKRVLPSKYLRAALGATGKSPSVSQVSEYMRVMGVTKGDALSLGELAHAYSYMFADPERDEYGRVGSYYDRLWGSGRPLDGSVAQRAIRGDVETIAVIAAQCFRSGEWRGTRKEHEALLRKLAIGRAAEQVDELKKLVRAFEALDPEETGEIEASSVEDALRDAGRNTAPLKATIEDFVKTRAKVAMPELLAAFGFVFESITPSPTVASAFAMLRLHTTPKDARVVGQAAIQYLSKVIDRPDDARHWQIKAREEAFRVKIGQFRGGIELMHAIGFEPSRLANRPAGPGHGEKEVGVQMLALRGTLDKHGRSMVEGVPKDTLATLRVRRDEVEHELRVLDGGVPAIGEAVRSLQEECTLVELRVAVQTGLSMVSGVLRNPKDSRLWRVRGANPTFLKKIGKWRSGPKLMQAIGFELQTKANVFVLHGTETAAEAGQSQFKFPELAKETEELLWRRKADLEAALRALEVSIITGKPAIGEGPRSAAPRQPTAADRRRQKAEGNMAAVSAARHERKVDLESLMHGRSVAERLQLNMIRDAFRALDKNGDGWITAADLKLAFKEKGRPHSDAVVAEWIKAHDIDQDGVVSLAEFMASFAAFMQPTAAVARVESQLAESNGAFAPAPDVVSALARAFGLMKLFNTPRRVQALCEAMETLVAKALKAVEAAARTSASSSGGQQVHEVSSDKVDRLFGRSRGAKELAQALGWLYNEATGCLSLRWKSKPPSAAKTRELMRELKVHERGLDFPGIADARAVGSAVAELGQSVSTRSNSPTSWLGAMETFLRYLENIVKEPRELRFRRINLQNEAFRRRIGRIGGGIDLFLALGFVEKENATLVLPENALDIGALRARQLEVEAGLKRLRSSAKESAALESATAAAAAAAVNPVKKSNAPSKTLRQGGKEQNPGAANDSPRLAASQKAHHGFAAERIESIRVRELEAQVQVLKDKLDVRAQRESRTRAAQPFAVSINTLPASSRSRSRSLSARSTSANPPASSRLRSDKALSSVLAAPAPRGVSRIPVLSSAGFQVGNLVQVGSHNANQETRFIAALAGGSVELDKPLELAHEEGEAIAVVKATKVELQRFKRHKLKSFIRDDILGPLVERVARAGEEAVLALDLQAKFEQRPLPKAIFSCTQVLDRHCARGVAGPGPKPGFRRSWLAALPDLGRIYLLGARNTLVALQERAELSELHELFEMIDLDGDGCVNRQEVLAAARAEPRIAALLRAEALPARDLSASAGSEDPTSASLSQVFQRVVGSASRAGSLSWEDFAAFFFARVGAAARDRATSTWWEAQALWRGQPWAKRLTDPRVAQLHVLFVLFDEDEDGRLARREWETACEFMDGLLLADCRDAFESLAGRKSLAFGDFCRLRTAVVQRRPSSRLAMRGESDRFFWEAGSRAVLRGELRRIFGEVLAGQPSAGSGVSRDALARALLEDVVISELGSTPVGPSDALEARLRELVSKRDKEEIHWPDLASCLAPNRHGDPTSLFAASADVREGDLAKALGETPLYEVASDATLNRVFVLTVDGEVQVWDAALECKLASKMLFEGGVAAAVGLRDASTGFRCLTYDRESSLLVVSTAFADRRVRFLDSLSLMELRSVQLQPALEDGESQIADTVFAQKWDAIACTVTAGHSLVQILCARRGQPLAVLRGHEADRTPPAMLLVPQADVLVTGGGGGKVLFWDLSDQLAWRLRAVDDEFGGASDALFSRVRDHLRERASLERGYRLAKIVERSGATTVSVRFLDEVGGIGRDIAMARVVMRDDATDFSVQPGTVVEVHESETVLVTVSRVDHDKGTMDVIVDQTGEAWAEVPIPERADKVQIQEGLKSHIPRPPEYADIGNVFDVLDADGDGEVSKEELAHMLVGRLGLPLLAHEVDRVFRTFDSNGDGRVSLRELSTGLQKRVQRPCKPRKPRELACRKSTHADGAQRIVALTFLPGAGLVVAASSCGSLHMFDPVSRPHRLVHPLYLERHPGVRPETTKSAAPYAQVMRMSASGLKVHQVVTVELPYACHDVGAPVAFDKATARAALEFDRHLAQEGRAEGLVRGFAYVFQDGAALCVPWDGFDERLVLLDDRSLFDSVGAMSSVGGWRSGTDNLRQVFRGRESLSRVIYFATHQLPGAREVQALMEQRGACLMDRESMERALQRPKVQVFPFYRDGDGPMQSMPPARLMGPSKSFVEESGTVTRRLRGNLFEVAFERSRSLLKLPGEALRSIGAPNGSIDGATFCVGERVQLRRNRVPSEQAIPELDARDDNRAGRDQGPSEAVVEFLFAFCSDEDGAGRVLAWSIQRTSVLRPAILFDQALSSEQLSVVRRAQHDHLSMALQSLRSSAASLRHNWNLARQSENALYARIGALLRQVSLKAEAAQDGAVEASLGEAFDLCLRLPFRWGARLQAMVTRFRLIFETASDGPEAAVSKVLVALQQELLAGDDVNNYALLPGTGPSLERFEGALSLAGSREKVSCADLLDCAMQMHAEALTHDQLFEALRRVNFVRTSGDEPDRVRKVCTVQCRRPGRFGDLFCLADRASFTRVVSRLDPFWAVRDQLDAISKAPTAEAEAAHGGMSSEQPLEEMALALECSAKISSCGSALGEMVAVLRRRASELVTARAETRLWRARPSKTREIDGALLESDILESMRSQLPDRNHHNSGPAALSFRVHDFDRRRHLCSRGRLVYGGKGWYSSGRVSESIPLLVHVISEDKLDRLQVCDGEPYAAHVERELALYRLVEADHVVGPALVENAALASSATVLSEAEPGLQAGARAVVFAGLEGWRTMSDVFAKNGFVGAAERLPLLRLWGIQLLHHLHKLHSKGILLRGPRPRNVLVSPCGRYVQIADLTTAGLLGVEGSDEGVVVCAPDLAEVTSSQERGYDPVHDLVATREYDTWCFGALLLEAVTGCRPPLPDESGAEPVPLLECLRPSGVSRGVSGSLDVGPRGELQLCYPSGEIAAPEARNIAELHALAGALEAGSFASLFPNSIRVAEKDRAVLDVISLCMHRSVSQRPLPADLLETDFFAMTQEELELAEEAAVALMTADSPAINVQDRIASPMAVLLQQLDADANAQANADEGTSVVDARLLLDVVESMVDACCDGSGRAAKAEDLRDAPSLCDEVVALGAFGKVVSLAVRLLADSDANGEGGEDHLAHKLVKRLVQALQTICAELSREESAMSRYAPELLHAVLRLYFGRLDDLPPSEGGLPVLKAGVLWNPTLERLVAPLVRQLCTEEGGGNARYPVLRAYVAACSRRREEGVHALLGLADPGGEGRRFGRSSAYLGYVLTIGQSLAQVRTAASGSRTRVVAARQLAALATSDALEVLQLCVDANAGPALAGLLSDPDSQVRELALECAQEIMGDLQERWSGGGDGDAMALFRGNLAAAFAAVPAVVAMAQRLSSAEHSRDRAPVLRVLRSQVEAGEKWTAAWAAADLGRILHVLVRRRRDEQAVLLCSRMAASGSSGMLRLLHCAGSLCQTLAVEHGVDVPQETSSDEEDTIEVLGRLRDDVRDAQIVEDLLMVLPRVKAVLQSPIVAHLYEPCEAESKETNEMDDDADEGSSADGGAGEINLLVVARDLYADVLSQVWGKWFGSLWESARLAEAAAARTQLTVLRELCGLARLALNDRRGVAARQALVRLFTEAGAFQALCEVVRSRDEDPRQTGPELLELQAEIVRFLCCECLAVRRLAEEEDIVGCFSTFLQASADLLRSCASRSNERSAALLAAWTRRHAAALAAWRSICSSGGPAVLARVLSSGVLAHVVQDLLADRTLLRAESHQYALLEKLGRHHDSFPLRELGVAMVSAVAAYQDEAPQLVAELVAVLKRCNSLRTERDRAFASKHAREAKSVRVLVRVLATIRNAALEDMLKRDADVPDGLVERSRAQRGMAGAALRKRLEAEDAWEEWAAVTTSRREGGALRHETSESDARAIPAISQAVRLDAQRPSPQHRRSARKAKNARQDVGQAESKPSVDRDSTALLERLGEDIVRVKALFQQYARKQLLDGAGLGKILRELRIEAACGAVARAMVREGRRMSLIDFCAFYESHVAGAERPARKSLLDKVFERYDKDGDGVLSLSEAQVALGSIAGCRAVMTDEIQSLARGLGLGDSAHFSAASFARLHAEWSKRSSGSTGSEAFAAHGQSSYFLHGMRNIRAYLADQLGAEAMPSRAEILAVVAEIRGGPAVDPEQLALDESESSELVETLRAAESQQQERRQARARTRSKPARSPSDSDFGGAMNPHDPLAVSTRRRSISAAPQADTAPGSLALEDVIDTVPEATRKALGSKLGGLWRAFARYGGDRDGKVTFVRLRTAFNELGRSAVGDAELYRWIRERDSAGTGQVSFADFCRALAS